MRRRSGFTLIELLVVIAIISLLVSLLIPALNKAKDHARWAICKTNLHHFGLGVTLHQQDFEHRLLPLYDGVDTWFTALNKYVEARDMFVCPTRPERNGFYYLNIGYAYNYCYMTYVCSPDTGNFAASFSNYSRGIKLDMIERPAETIAITDSNLHDFDGNPQYYVGWQPNPALLDLMIVPETRHFDVADILFADGHVGELGDETFHDPTLWDRK